MKKVTAPAKVQVVLPYRSADGRLYYYGYDVAMEWLMDYFKTHWPQGSSCDVFTKTVGGVHFLRNHSDIKHLDLESAFKDETAPSNVVTIPGRPGEIRVPIISIFSNERTSYKKRPSQEQVDRLTEIMGKQPRWWLDYEDPDTYDE